ncbi:MAG: integrase [Chloroflexi bacterium]|nr:MAG: integrase [Chloroflexota bacterium]
MLDTYTPTDSSNSVRPWNKGRVTGQKPPLKPKEVWSIRVRLQMTDSTRDLALFNLAIDSKLRGCDLVALRVADVFLAGKARERTSIVQKKTGRPVQFELSTQTQDSTCAWVGERKLLQSDFLFPSRFRAKPNLSTRQYSRIVGRWVESIGLNPRDYGTHSLRRTKVALIYKKTGNLRAIQLLLGHTKLESTVRYLGVEVDDALRISQDVEL